MDLQMTVPFEFIACPVSLSRAFDKLQNARLWVILSVSGVCLLYLILGLACGFTLRDC